MPLAIPLAALGRFHDALPLFLRPVQFRVAETLEEFRAAAHLAYDESVARNYLQPASPQLKLTLHQALPQTTTLIAKHRTAGVIGTVTLIEDSPLGLPMDDGYKAELDHMRRGGLRLAEAALLTVDQRVFGPGVCAMFHTKKLLLILRLLQVMYEYTRSCTRVQELVACFNPRHHVLFEYLQMEHLGGLKAYAGANGSPTVARHVTIADMAQKAASHPAHRLFYGRVSQRRFAKKLVLSAEQLRLLFVLDTPLFASAIPTELAHISSCYPTYNFSEIYEGIAPASRRPAKIGDSR